MIIQDKSPSSSLQVQQSRPPSTSAISIDIIQNSVEKLITSWNRRQKWNKLFFNSAPQQGTTGKSPWRVDLANFLESTPVRIIAISLLLTDLIFTILELSSSLLSCKSTTSSKGAEETWYHWIGIVILSLLSLKSLCLVVALGGLFFRRVGYVVDGVVLVVALLLEVFLEKMGGGLVIVVSLWRVVRVVESAFELSDETIEAQIEGIVCEFQALKDENGRLLRIIDDKDEVIHNLQEQLDHLYKAAS
ncbi:voltage-gated hydrogen channel 1 [Heracleum sosnowskyi]|uniref:Voltage-gated hydrogen channel 1 n=1 Tax=Heracleum sosnowskyi TaxID=360622 RepID=A0AAD8IHH0_9APIA|nr:voltage-gated hydrogen channel 1 [Heracleum sosnowskyi]